jgi:hypothetical protein
MVDSCRGPAGFSPRAVARKNASHESAAADTRAGVGRTARPAMFCGCVARSRASSRRGSIRRHARWMPGRGLECRNGRPHARADLTSRSRELRSCRDGLQNHAVAWVTPLELARDRNVLHTGTPDLRDSSARLEESSPSRMARRPIIDSSRKRSACLTTTRGSTRPILTSRRSKVLSRYPASWAPRCSASAARSDVQQVTGNSIEEVFRGRIPSRVACIVWAA